jgi:hypothetical protein
MNKYRANLRHFYLIAGLLAAGINLGLAGCYAGPHGGGYASVEVAGGDDYGYYPGSETYYNNTRHHYVYREGNAWVNRPDPPHEWAKDAPSVHVGFHDAPEKHHAEISHTYPKNWKQPAPQHEEHHDDHPDHQK